MKELLINYRGLCCPENECSENGCFTSDKEEYATVKRLFDEFIATENVDSSFHVVITNEAMADTWEVRVDGKKIECSADIEDSADALYEDFGKFVFNATVSSQSERV